MTTKKLPPEIIIQLAPLVERLRSTGETVDEIDAEMRKLFEEDKFNFPIDQLYKHIEAMEKYFTRNQKTFNFLDKNNLDDPASLALRELFAERLKKQRACEEYWKAALRSKLT